MDTVDYSSLGQNVAVEVVECGHCDMAKGNFTCEHGPNECAGNLAIMCGLHVTKECDHVGAPGDSKGPRPPFHVLPPWAAFVQCMNQAQGAMSTTASLKRCLMVGFAGCPMAQARVAQQCMDGPDGEQLMAAAYQQSKAANVTGPSASQPHRVPFLTIDGKPLGDDPSKLKQAVCDVIANDPTRKLVNPGACD